MPIGSTFYRFNFAGLQGLGVYLGGNDGAFADFSFNFLPFYLRCGCGRFFEGGVMKMDYRGFMMCFRVWLNGVGWRRKGWI